MMMVLVYGVYKVCLYCCPLLVQLIDEMLSVFMLCV